MDSQWGAGGATFLAPGLFLLSRAALVAKMVPKPFLKSPRDQSKRGFSKILGRFWIDFGGMCFHHMGYFWSSVSP